MSAAVEIHVVEAEGLIHSVRLVDGRPVDMLAEPVARPLAWGAMVAAPVIRRDAGGRGGWVDLGALGESRPGWVRPGRPGTPALPPAGGLALVQVTADARADKGCELTLDVALPGRLLVYRPFGDGVAGARSLAKPAVQRVKPTLSERGGGWILRRAAADAGADHITDEAERLVARWAAVLPRSATAGVVLPPPGVALRMALDTATLDAILVADPAGFGRLTRDLQAVAPSLGDRLRRDAADALDRLPDLESAIVPLSRGGSLAVEATRALTAIDVDAGGAGDLLAVNREAAALVARHLRLRNIGGTVVVDFATLRRPRDAASVIGQLKQGLADDPAQCHVADAFGPFGLVALARQRRGLCYGEALQRARTPGDTDR